jgi:hypothetical protein
MYTLGLPENMIIISDYSIIYKKEKDSTKYGGDKDVVIEVLEEDPRYFKALQTEYPDRITIYHEHGIDSNTVIQNSYRCDRGYGSWDINCDWLAACVQG